MVKKKLILITLILLTSCNTGLINLTIKKIPYLGDELRIDGYYYSDLDFNNNLSAAVFYKDGFCIHTRIASPVNQDTLNYIENEILLNDKYIAKMKKDPFHIGVFQIIYPNIEFEVWEYKAWTFTYSGKIINDSTFIINKSICNENGKIYLENLTYRFKPFSSKPDSTNVWIE